MSSADTNTSDTKIHKGICHCGNVSFSFEHEGEITSGLRCNCSICIRKGAVMTDFVIAPDNFKSDVKEKGSLGLYQFDDKVANHYFCKQCGIYPFHTTFRMPGHFRVNVGCLEDVDPLVIEVSVFDGKTL